MPMKIARKCIIVFLYGCDKRRTLFLAHTDDTAV